MVGIPAGTAAGLERLLSLLGFSCVTIILPAKTAAGRSLYSTLEILGWESTSLAHKRFCSGALAL